MNIVRHTLKTLLMITFRVPLVQVTFVCYKWNFLYDFNFSFPVVEPLDSRSAPAHGPQIRSCGLWYGY